METQVQVKKGGLPWKKIIGSGFILGLIGAAFGYYYYTKKVPSTKDIKANFTLSAADLIAEFDKDETAATTKYNAKILSVKGSVVSIESTDSTCAVTIGNSENLGNVRCDFAKEFIAEGKALKENDVVSIKGKCNGKLLDVVLNVCTKE
jgi:tRNA_anti-like